MTTISSGTAEAALARTVLDLGRQLLYPTLPLFVPPYRALTRRAWRNYRHVFANSTTTRAQILAKGAL